MSWFTCGSTSAGGRCSCRPTWAARSSFGFAAGIITSTIHSRSKPIARRLATAPQRPAGSGSAFASHTRLFVGFGPLEILLEAAQVGLQLGGLGFRVLTCPGGRLLGGHRSDGACRSCRGWPLKDQLVLTSVRLLCGNQLPTECACLSSSWASAALAMKRSARRSSAAVSFRRRQRSAANWTRPPSRPAPSAALQPPPPPTTGPSALRAAKHRGVPVDSRGGAPDRPANRWQSRPRLRPPSS